MAEGPKSPKGLDEILKRWRQIVMDKKRQIITPEEVIAQKVGFLKDWIFSDAEPLDSWEIREFKYTRKRERIYTDREWRPIRVGQTWGGADMSAHFRCSTSVPERFAGKKVVLKVYFDGDGLLTVNGVPYHGLDPFRDTVLLADKAKGGEKFDFEAECYIMWHAGESLVKNFECSHLAVVDQEMHDTYWDLQIPVKVMLTEEIDPQVREYLKAVLWEAAWHIDHNETDPARIREMARTARTIVREQVYGADLFSRAGLINYTGNSHLDVCFMWTHAEFVRKLGRTTATALRLIEQYPEYVFAQSQALMYEELKNNYPDLFKQVQQRTREGRWEVIGAFWVEPDANLISGESFVRQIMHGVRFFEKEFGVTPTTVWNPDVFGNAWTMPQILRRAGVRHFVTHKMILWNDTNTWTTNAFWWQGPDGSRIFANVPPTGFIGTLEPDHVTEHWTKFSEKDTLGESLYHYGWGDGGGGPDVEMLESIDRFKNFPGITPGRHTRVQDALDRLYEKAVDSDDIAVHNDELYLEEHRGTYTTKGLFKKLNRHCENTYREAELFASFAPQAYPQQELFDGWKEVLTNQFHDSLPGSHVRVVYEDLVESYGRCVPVGEKALRNAIEGIAEKVNTTGEGRAVVVFNSLGHNRTTLVAVEMDDADIRIFDPQGAEIAHQFITHYETGKRMLVFYADDVPQAGYAVYRVVSGTSKLKASPVSVTASSLENDFLRVEISPEGEVVSLFDKTTNREAIDADLHGNVFHLFEDNPGRHEAWDIVSTYEKLEFDMGEASVRVLEKGPVRSCIEVTRTFRNSRIIQRIVLGAKARRVDFETYVDWQEQIKLLKVRFNTTVNSRYATYDLPFGNIERPTTRNNSYEAAKFEVPGHLWMDISQADYGLSLLNDCKYGHEAFGKMIGLTLLKGPTFPDPVSDLGDHWFTYSLYPHIKCWREGQTHREALDLNNRAEVVLTDGKAGELPAAHSFIMIEGDGVALETVKRAEESDDLIVRLVERHGGQTDVAVRFASAVTKVSECNLLERDEDPVDHTSEGFDFVIKPYEIRSFKVSI